MKLWKWHTMVFRCPCCGKQRDYASQVVEGPTRGSSWDPTYYCEHCKVSMRVRDKWLFGGVYGPVMAMIATFAYEALPSAWHVGADRLPALRRRLLRDRRLSAES